MEWVNTKDRLPTAEDARPIRDYLGAVQWARQVFVVTDGVVNATAYYYVREEKHSAWCRVPEYKIWRKPTLDDLKNGPVKCRWGDNLEKGGMLSAIDVQASTSRPYFVLVPPADFWATKCEIEVTV